MYQDLKSQLLQSPTYSLQYTTKTGWSFPKYLLCALMQMIGV
jgi:hypothetical protein